jgi:hypothetical protein
VAAAVSGWAVVESLVWKVAARRFLAWSSGGGDGVWVGDGCENFFFFFNTKK